MIQENQTLESSAKLKVGRSVSLQTKKFKKVSTTDTRTRGGKFIPNSKPSQEEKKDIYKDLPDTESADKFFDLNEDTSDVRSNAMDAIKKLQKK